MSTIRLSAFIIAAGFLAPQIARGTDLLDEVRAGNRSALESIRTLRCVITRSVLVSPIGPPVNVRTEYWSSGSSSRVRSEDARGVTESVVNESVLRSIVPVRDRKGIERMRFARMAIEPGQPHGQSDPWGCGLLKLCGPKGWPRSLDELLSNAHNLKQVERRTEDGTEFVVVQLSLDLLPDESGEFEFWFDPNVNYLATKLIGTSQRGGSLRRRESNVLAFKEIQPSVYFPERVETRHYDGGRLISHEVTQFSEIEINRPIPSNTFQLAVPAGAIVYDAIDGVEYEADSSGNRVGGSREIVRFPPLSAATGATTVEEGRYFLSQSILVASLAVFVITCSIWLWRRVKQDKDA